MKNVLILEEDAEGRQTLAKVLRARGFGVFQAGDDESAIEIITGAVPAVDLVIASATVRDRLEFLADVRLFKPRLPVIFLADYCEPESRLRGLAFGAFSMSHRHNFFINLRPVAFRELDRLIRIALNKHPYTMMQKFAAA